MCQNIQKIRTKTGKEIYVSCGKCEACLQTKADMRSLRILNEYPDDGDTIALFGALTYDDKYVPYILRSDLISALCNFPQNYTDFIRVPIYRDFIQRWVRCSHDDYLSYPCSLRKSFVNSCNCTVFMICKDVPYVDDFGTNVIDYLEIDFISAFQQEIDKLPHLEHYSDRISILYYKDVQDFIKRLRVNLYRTYHVEIPIRYFVCGEYGGKRTRSHFHPLIFISKDYVSQVKHAIAQSWTYDYRKPRRARIEVARHAASYVSSYVNCISSVPIIFRNSKFARIKHSYSFGFGCSKAHLSLPSIFKMFRKGSFLYTSDEVRNNVLSSFTHRIPSYVISRYAPKFKGYCRFTRNEIYDIAEEPTRLFTNKRYKYKQHQLNLEDFDNLKNPTIQHFLTKDSEFICKLQSFYDWKKLNEITRQTIVMLQNKQKFWLSKGFSKQDFAEFYSGAWSLLASDSLKLIHEKFDLPSKFQQLYYNIQDYYEGKVLNSALDSNMFLLPSNYHYEVNPNNFVDVVVDDIDKRQKYFRYDKAKKSYSLMFKD